MQGLRTTWHRNSDSAEANKAGVWTFEYWIPDEFGLFGHSGEVGVCLAIAVELWDSHQEKWVHIQGSPFNVTVAVMLAESPHF